jgi:hypothetical protein
MELHKNCKLKRLRYKVRESCFFYNRKKYSERMCSWSLQCPFRSKFEKSCIRFRVHFATNRNSFKSCVGQKWLIQNIKPVLWDWLPPSLYFLQRQQMQSLTWFEQRWQWCCQPYVPAVIHHPHPHEYSWYSFQLETVNPRATVPLEGLGKLGGGGNRWQYISW